MKKKPVISKKRNGPILRPLRGFQSTYEELKRVSASLVWILHILSLF